MTIPDVEILTRSDVGAMCRIKGRSLWIGVMAAPASMPLPPAGAITALVLFEWAARDLGLFP